MTQPITPSVPRYPSVPVDAACPPPPACACDAAPSAPSAPLPPSLAVSTATVAADAKNAAVQSRLDAFLQAMKGPYQTPDGTQWVAPPFRLSTPYFAQAASIQQNAGLLEAAREHAGLTTADLNQVESGRGTADQIHRLTQALIDVSGQPPGGGPWTAENIRQLMFHCGVGVDCASYAQQAYLKATGESRAQAGFVAPTNEDLSSLDRRGFVAVGDLSDVRAGDVVVLAPPTPQGMGHRAIVYDQHLATPADARALINLGPSAQTFAVGGPIRVLEVDSSWGSGGHVEVGGVERQTWYYNEGTKTWAWLQDAPASGDGSSATSTFLTSSQPYDHPLEGIYRQPSATRSAP